MRNFAPQTQSESLSDMQEVVLVNPSDDPIGTMEKLEAHRKGLLHRAFSVFIFNENDELLLQQRAVEKYHSGGLWTNTCCSHPTPYESLETAGSKRLQEEMGFTAPLENRFAFEYRVELDNGYTEHEFDHVLTGRYNGPVEPDPSEVMDYKWISLADLNEDIARNPERYTSWFKIIMDDYRQQITEIIA
jgi:isopentenyl-diphosphate Delta-isomerase